MANELELPFSNEGCEKCEMSYLTTGWDCVCDLLVEAGNCPDCLNLPEKCKCEKKILHQHWTEYIPADLPDYGDIPDGYQLVVHRFRTELVPLDQPVAFTPGF